MDEHYHGRPDFLYGETFPLTPGTVTLSDCLLLLCLDSDPHVPS